MRKHGSAIIMVAESVNQFDLFDFFSVLIPGITLLIGFYPLLPVENNITGITAISIVLILGYVVGRGIHSVAVWWEDVGHREIFRGEMREPVVVPYTVSRTFYKQCRSDYPELHLPRNPNEALNRTIDTLYTHVRARTHMDGRGRSRSFQAIYAFYRNVAFVGASLGATYFMYGLLGGTFETLQRYGIAVEMAEYPYTSILLDLGISPGLLIPASSGLSLVVWLICKKSMEKYQQHYITYLISDHFHLSDPAR